MYRNTCVMYRNMFHVPQHVLCTATRVMYCNTCHVLQHVSCTATRVMYRNTFHVPQHVSCTATHVTCTATVFKFVILFLPSLFQFIYYLPLCFILLLTFNIFFIFSYLCFPYYFSIYHSVNFRILNVFLAGPFISPFASLKICIFLLTFSVHSLIQFFLVPSDILFWLKN